MVKFKFFGDFNARTAEIIDYISDDNLPQNIINSSTLLQYKNDAGSNCRERNNTDKVVNIFGRKLIDMCKSTGLKILN